MKAVPGCSVILLGTGTPNAEPDRSGPSVAIAYGDSCCLVDCGPGVVRRAMAAYSAGIRQLAPPLLDTAFITHLHSDHTTGLPDLLLTPWVLERTAPLRLFGPAGLAGMVSCVTEAWSIDIGGRLQGDEPINPTGFASEVFEVAEGEVYRDGDLLVEAIPVRHGLFQSFGYRFTCSGRTVVVSGDTASSDAVIEASRGCDILVHEVYSSRGLESKSSDWQGYYSGHHTSATELAEIASEARPALLVLYHQLYCGVSDHELLEEVREGYGGLVVSGRDLDIY